MKRVLIEQTGVGESEYIRKFVLEVPDDWDEGDIDGVRLKNIETEDGIIEWELDYSPTSITVNGQTVSPYDEDRCWRLPVVRLCGNLEEE